MLDHGGITVVARAAGFGAVTVSKGVTELEVGAAPAKWVRRPVRAVTPHGRRPGAGRCAAGLAEPDERGDPCSPPAVDHQVHPHPGAGAEPAGPPGRSVDGGQPAARAGVRPTGQRQGDRGRRPGRSRCPVRLPQCPKRRSHRRRPAGDQCGHPRRGSSSAPPTRMLDPSGGRQESRSGSTCTTS